MNNYNQFPPALPQTNVSKKKSKFGKIALFGCGGIIGLFLIIIIIALIVGSTMTPEEAAALKRENQKVIFDEELADFNKAREKAKTDILKNIENNKRYAENHVKNNFKYFIKPFLKDPESLQIREIYLIRTEYHDTYVKTKYNDYITDFSCDTTLRNKELTDTIKYPIQIYNVYYGAKNSFGGYIVDNKTVRLNLQSNEVFFGAD